MRLARILTAALLLAMSLAGCSFLPSQGPSASDVIAGAQPAGGDGLPRYLIADLDARTVDILKHEPNATLAGRFGTRNAAPNPVIGVGDSVAVTVWEAASGGLFSAGLVAGVTAGSHSATIPPQVVGRDGNITIPYAGRIHVAGHTPAQVERTVVKRLLGKAIEPQALVTVTQNISNTVTVTGEVASGARVPISAGGDRVLDVIAAAGGIKAPVHEVFIDLSRGGYTAKVPMQALLNHPRENIYVRPRDILTVVREPQTFTAFGSTGTNALVHFDAAGITLEEAVAKAGGLVGSMANPEGVFLLRAEPVAIARLLDPSYPIPPDARTVNVVYRINLKDPSTYFMARKFQVRNKDMIYVAAAPAVEFYKAMQLFSTITQPAITGAGIGMSVATTVK